MAGVDPRGWVRHGVPIATVASLLVILLVAFGLRTLDLSTNPPALFEDELAGAASAWSIVTTGHDLEATHLPFLATRLELKMPVYGLATLPFQLLDGHTTMAVRLPAALFGTLATGLLFWLVRVLGRRRIEALLAAAVFATAPWAVHVGRVGWEPAAVLPFTIGGVGLLVDGLWRGRPWRIAWAAVVLAVGGYAYQPALLEHALLALVVSAVFVTRLDRDRIVALGAGAVLAMAILVPYLLAFADPVFTQRTVGVSVFRDGITLDAFSVVWAHYWAQWDPVFLFFAPTFNQRNNPGMGALMPILLPILLVGLVRLVRMPGPARAVVLAWLAVAPVAAALTDDTVPHFLRGVFALPPIAILAGRGLEPIGARIVSLVRSSDRVDRARGFISAASLVVMGAILVQATFTPYFTVYPIANGGVWGKGTDAAMALVRERVPDGKPVCIDTAVFSYWTYPHWVAWYLSDRTGIVERWDGEGCDRAGAYVLARGDTPVTGGMTEVSRLDPAVSPFEVILWQVPAAP